MIKALPWEICVHDDVVLVERCCMTCRIVLSQRSVMRGEGQGCDSAREWYISLRNSCASFFAHIPQAWPHPAALSLDGFKYMRTSPLGPLAPTIRAKALGKSKWRREAINRAYDYNLPTMLDRVLWFKTNGGKAVKEFTCWFALSIGFIHVSIFCLSYLTKIDVSISYMWAISLAIAIGLAMAWDALREGDPSQRQASPLALQYLKRQRLEINRYQAVPVAYSPLDPYGVAAGALREVGRYLSADLVDFERIRLRVRLLSYRHHGIMKVSLCFMEKLSKYGYDVSGLVRIGALSVILLASLVWTGAAFGWLVSRGNGDTAHVVATVPGRSQFQERCSTPVVDECPGLLYALDIMTPMLDLGLDVWAPPTHLISNRTALEKVAGYVFGILPLLGKLWGYVLSATLGAAVALRVGAAFSRHRE